MVTATRRWQYLVIGSLVAAFAVLLAACGSANVAKQPRKASNQAIVQAAKQEVQAASHPHPTFDWITQPAKPPAGKKIEVLSCSQATTACSSIAAVAAQAARDVGWKATICDGKASPSAENACIEEAIAEGDNGILLDAIDQSYISSSLANAEAKGIKVASIWENNVPGGRGTVQADMYLAPKVQAKLTADYLIAATDGHAKVLYLESPEFPTMYDQVPEVKKQLGKCSGCSIVATSIVNYATVTTQLAPTVSGILASHPQINYIIEPFSDISPFVAQGITTSGRSGKVKIFSQACQPPGNVQIEKGGPTVACLALPQPAGGWYGVDLLIRLFDHLPVPLPNSKSLPYFNNTRGLPVMLADKSNIGEVTSGPYGFWSGDINFKAHFYKLWGLTGSSVK